jgi:hypothetical protein
MFLSQFDVIRIFELFFELNKDFISEAVCTPAILELRVAYRISANYSNVCASS